MIERRSESVDPDLIPLAASTETCVVIYTTRPGRQEWIATDRDGAFDLERPGIDGGRSE